MNAKERFYSGMAAHTISQITSSRNQWTSFLTTIGRNYGFTYPEQIMIHAQRPEATLCKEYDSWLNEKNRYVKRGSKGIALFVTDRDMFSMCLTPAPVAIPLLWMNCGRLKNSTENLSRKLWKMLLA